MNPPANMNLGMMGMNQLPQTATSMSASVGPGGNNAGLGGSAPGGAAGGPGGVGGSGMHLLAGMSPMVGMNAGTGHGMNMNMSSMLPPGASGPAGANGVDASTMGGMGDLSTMFSQEFMQGMTSALDDIDPSMFKQEGNLDFERDFSQWFGHPDDSLDLK